MTHHKLLMPITNMYSISELTHKINNAIDSFSYQSKPERLYEPINYIMSIGGKRIRPVLMLMAYNVWDDDVDKILNQALGLEFYHNFTLLHDDLMDKSEVRRGKPTVHKKWNDNTAILSGDTMLIMAYKLFGENKAYQDFIDATLGVCEGQQYDMEFENRIDVTEEEYMEMIRLKTSLLLGYALKIGSILAEADEEDAMKMYNFGEKMGLAYQIQDDILDVYGDTKLFQKKLGADIVDNKKTYLLINALNKANEEQKKELESWIEMESFDVEKKISAVTDIYNILGIKQYAQTKVETLFSSALESLELVNVPNERKLILKEFANLLLDRKY